MEEQLTSLPRLEKQADASKKCAAAPIDWLTFALAGESRRYLLLARIEPAERLPERAL